MVHDHIFPNSGHYMGFGEAIHPLRVTKTGKEKYSKMHNIILIYFIVIFSLFRSVSLYNTLVT